MGKPAALFTSAIVLIASIVLTSFTASVVADEGKAKVYLLCLNGVGGNWVENPSRVKEGAILALSPTERTQIPRVHAKHGKTSPFYDVKYEVVTSWGIYKNLIENYSEIVILNTHGEILPIPASYRNNETGWVGNIARAMLYRRISWVHVGGYPFFQIWNEGDATFQEWPSGGAFGFRNLTSYINKPNVDCWPPGPESEKIALNTGTAQDFGRDYQFMYEAFYIERGRPLKAADFNEYLLKAINGVGDYYTSAAIAFGLVSIGLTIASFMESLESFGVIQSFINLPLFFLSGALFPIRGDQVPGWLQTVSHFNPLTYGVDALRTIVLGAAWQPLYPLYFDLAVVCCFDILMIVVGTLRSAEENSLPPNPRILRICHKFRRETTRLFRNNQPSDYCKSLLLKAGLKSNGKWLNEIAWICRWHWLDFKRGVLSSHQ
jgi:hypothetical protein